MGKNKSKEFKYHKQGSIDDENFLMLAHNLGKIENAIENSESGESVEVNVDLTETNEKLSEINSSIKNVDLSEINDILKDGLENSETNFNKFYENFRPILASIQADTNNLDSRINRIFSTAQAQHYLNELNVALNDSNISAITNSIDNINITIKSFLDEIKDLLFMEVD